LVKTAGTAAALDAGTTAAELAYYDSYVAMIAVAVHNIATAADTRPSAADAVQETDPDPGVC
jgi:hypothetical protein